MRDLLFWVINFNSLIELFCYLDFRFKFGCGLFVIMTISGLLFRIGDW